MADVKISELAKTVGVSVDKLLSQIKEAGLPHVGPDELISNDDKNALLVFLRRSHGDREATNAAPKKIIFYFIKNCRFIKKTFIKTSGSFAA